MQVLTSSLIIGGRRSARVAVNGCSFGLTPSPQARTSIDRDGSVLLPAGLSRMINTSTAPQPVPNLDPNLDAPENFDPWPTAAEFVEELVGDELHTYVFDADGWLIDAWSVAV